MKEEKEEDAVVKEIEDAPSPSNDAGELAKAVSEALKLVKIVTVPEDQAPKADVIIPVP